MNTFFVTLPKNIFKSFSGKHILFHLAAICATYIILMSGFDWKYFTLVRNETLNYIFFPAIVIGGLLPILAPLILIPFKKTRLIGWTLAQAAFIGSLISSTYKAFTGRVQPDIHNVLIDQSHSFNFGFMEHGVFWGWPSSHTTIAFAMAFALIMLFPQNRKVRFFAIVYALYIGVGISFAIHWFSEFIAGMLIGIAIGKSIEVTRTSTVESTSEKI